MTLATLSAPALERGANRRPDWRNTWRNTWRSAWLPEDPAARRRMLRNLAVAGLVLAIGILAAMTATASATTGAALKPAYDAINDMIGGYGKSLLVVIAFFVVLAGWFVSSQATGMVMKFVGFSVFGGVGLAAAIALTGAVV